MFRGVLIAGAIAVGIAGSPVAQGAPPVDNDNHLTIPGADDRLQRLLPELSGGLSGGCGAYLPGTARLPGRS
jgi:hypothetical protein